MPENPYQPPQEGSERPTDKNWLVRAKYIFWSLPCLAFSIVTGLAVGFFAFWITVDNGPVIADLMGLDIDGSGLADGFVFMLFGAAVSVVAACLATTGMMFLIFLLWFRVTRAAQRQDC